MRTSATLRYASLKLPNTAGWYRGIVDTLCCYTGGIPREWRQSAEDLGPPDLGYRCGHGEIHAVAVRARAPARTHARAPAPRAGAYARARAQAPAHAVCPYPPGPGTPYWVRCGRDGAGCPIQGPNPPGSGPRTTVLCTPAPGAHTRISGDPPTSLRRPPTSHRRPPTTSDHLRHPSRMASPIYPI